MESVKVFIVEDEAITVAILRDVLKEHGYDVCGTAHEGELAFKEINKTLPDIIILDIKLKGKKDGIWVAEQLNKVMKIPFIFLTAFGDKSSIARAVRTRPYGYLLKPFDDEDVFDAINLTLQNFSQNTIALFPKESINKSELQQSVATKNFIFIREKNLFVKVHFSDVLFLQADKNYVDIITESRKYTLRIALKDLLSSCSQYRFLQINRSVAVNLEQVDRYGQDVVVIKSNHLALTDNFRAQFLTEMEGLAN